PSTTPPRPAISTLSLHDALPISDPDKLLGNLSKDYALAVRFNVQNVPEDLRKNVGDIFRAGMEVGLQQKAGEDDIAFEFRRKMADRKSTRLNSSHVAISYAVFCL